MSLKQELEAEVSEIFRAPWNSREGRAIPDETSISLGNDAISLDATVLYADISDSTKLVENNKPEFAAEVYNSFLRSAAKLIRADGGSIAAYDGDRVMAVFIGDRKNNVATRVGLKLNYVSEHILRPAIRKQYPQSAFMLKHVVGIDTSRLFVTKTGVRGANDLLWMGNASNYAAKLCTLDDAYSTWITQSVFDSLSEDNKFSSDGRAMWEARLWTSVNNRAIYRSNWWWSV